MEGGLMRQQGPQIDQGCLVLAQRVRQGQREVVGGQETIVAVVISLPCTFVVAITFRGLSFLCALNQIAPVSQVCDRLDDLLQNIVVFPRLLDRPSKGSHGR